MNSQGFRHRDSEVSRPITPTGGSSPAERGREATQGGQPPATPATPATPSRQLPYPEAADLGSAAKLFQIAHSQTHPDPQNALEVLKVRVKGALQTDSRVTSVPSRTTLRDIASTTDSLWIPTLKTVLVVLVCALLAAAIYGIIQLFQPAHSELAPVAGYALGLISSL